MRCCPVPILFFTLLLCALPSGAARGDIPVQMAVVVDRFDALELSFQLTEKIANPYDPDDISVMGEFRSPSGKTLRVPGFFFREFDPIHNTIGRWSGWKVRFAPSEVGDYSVRVTVSQRRGPPTEKIFRKFKSIPSHRKGFVAVRDGHFTLSTGEDFLVLGANRCWGDVRETETYLHDMAALAKTQAKVVRVWLAPWWLPVEQRPGEFDQAAYARLDAIVAQAERLGLKIILCIEQHGNLQLKGAEIGRWAQHPYNIANGGPCRSVPDFFANSEARRLFENRLRYLAARYGYSTAIMAWELFNEVEYVDFGWSGLRGHMRAVSGWHIKMAATLRKHDAFQHLIATSADISLQRGLLDRKAIDFVQLHAYGDGDMAEVISKLVADLGKEERAPVVVSEFGRCERKDDTAYVTRGTFAAMLTARGGALPWLQDVKDTAPAYERLVAATKFFREIEWRVQKFKPVKVQVHLGEPGKRRSPLDSKVLAVQGKDHVIVFIYSPEKSDAAKRNESAMAQGLVVVPQARRGEYAVEVWNARAGTVLRRATATTAGLRSGSGLVLKFPLVTGDIAIRATWFR